MSGSDRAILVAAPGPGALVTVMDPSFATLAESLDRIELELDPGLYQVRFQQGRSVRDQLIKLRAGERREITSPAIAFASTAPLPGTKTSSAVHQQEAERLSREVHAPVGSGGELFVFLRELDRRGRGSLARGLSLHDLAGDRIVDFAAVAPHSDETAPRPWAGATVALDPGPYRLRAATPGYGASLEQVVWIEDGWQTQMLLERMSTGRTRAPRLPGATVLMAPVGVGYEPGDPDLPLAEVARQGLADRHPVLSEEDLERLLADGSGDPMLALYAGHLELLRRRPDVTTIRRLLALLTDVMPRHPDVRALRAWMGESDQTPFPSPPMLRSSWLIVVEGSVRRTAAVPLGSLAAEIAERLFGNGAWLTWHTPPRRGRRAPESSPALAVPELPAALEVLAGALHEADGSVELTPLEVEVGSLLDANVPTDTDAQVVSALGVPLQVAEEAVASLAQKLDVDLGA